MVAKMETTIWERLVDQSWDDLSPEAAQGMLRLRFSKVDLDRMNELGTGAQRGTLTAQQLEELDTYNRIGRMVAILQSKARLALQKAQVRR